MALTRVGLQSPVPLASTGDDAVELLPSRRSRRGDGRGGHSTEKLRNDGMLRDGAGARGRLGRGPLADHAAVVSASEFRRSSMGGFGGGLFGPVGALVGSALSSKVSEAQVVLFVTDAANGDSDVCRRGVGEDARLRRSGWFGEHRRRPRGLRWHQRVRAHPIAGRSSGELAAENSQRHPKFPETKCLDSRSWCS